MKLAWLTNIFRFLWMVESHAQQIAAWQDAEDARVGRALAEARAAAQLQAMLDANPSGQLGNARLNDDEVLQRSGLL